MRRMQPLFCLGASTVIRRGLRRKHLAPSTGWYGWEACSLLDPWKAQNKGDIRDLIKDCVPYLCLLISRLSPVAPSLWKLGWSHCPHHTGGKQRHGETK